MFKYLTVFAIGLVGALVLTPLAQWIAVRIGALDVPNERKVHTQPIPRLGGLALFASFHLAIVAGSYWFWHHGYLMTFLNREWWLGFLCASVIMVGLGAFDDVQRLGARVKFMVQVLAALVAVRFGYAITSVGLPWGGVWELGVWSVPVTVLWIVGLANAFNLIDGLDGLASGVALISSSTLMVIALLNQQIDLALWCAALAGCLLGFLRYNLHPAKIFLGDSGSLFLGFTLAIVGIETLNKTSVAVSVLVPMLALGLPIMDTLLAMIRRFLRASHVVEGDGQGKYRFLFLRSKQMFEADRDHIHHRLLRLGVNHRNTVFILYGVCLVGGALALALSAGRNLNAGLIFAALALVTTVAVQKLRYEEFQWLNGGALLPLVKSAVLRFEPFQILMDAAMLSLTYYLAWLIYGDGRFEGVNKLNFIQTLPAVLLAKLAVFYLTGLYRLKWEHAGVPDLLRATQSLVAGWVVAAVIIHFLLPVRFSHYVLLLDLFVMGYLLLGARLSLRVLQHYARANPGQKRPVLIYGASRSGSLLVRELLTNDGLGLTPVGFVDDDPHKLNKLFCGYRVWGACAQIENIIQQCGARELIIASESIGPKHLANITTCCARNGVTLRRFEIKLDVVSPASQTGPVRSAVNLTPV